MDNSSNSSQLVEAQPIWLQVAQLSAGFHHMEQLARELVELNGVGLDIRNTQSMIRRDVANAVLKTAIELKKSQSVLVPESEAPVSLVIPVKTDNQPQSDEWASRLVRWADQFGRDLFKRPSLRAPAGKSRDEGKSRADKVK